jgi:hypothetical protein
MTSTWDVHTQLELLWTGDQAANSLILGQAEVSFAALGLR